MNLQPSARARATFRPRRADDLKPGAVELVGASGEFEALWLIEDDEPYAGEWAMQVPPDWRGHFVWVPSGDLADMEELS